MPGYQIRARILDVYPIIWRRFLLRADNTFADLHYALQIALDWSDDFLHHFKLPGKIIGVPRMFNEYTHSATELTLADFNFKTGQRFLYEGVLWSRRPASNTTCFSNRPSPNRTCQFAGIRLSSKFNSVSVRHKFRDESCDDNFCIPQLFSCFFSS